MLVEVLSGHHRVRGRHRIAAGGDELSCTVGRSAACDVVLDDPFVAAVHARITVDAEGHIAVTDLQSVNGTEVGGRIVHGGEPVRLPDGVFRVGRTRLRVRTGHEVIAPEQADRGRSAWGSRSLERKLLVAGFTLGTAATVFEVWTSTAQPRELPTALVTTLLVTLTLAGLWIALWALTSRVAFGESRWMRHAVIVSVVYAALSVVAGVIDIVNGALGLHLPSAVGPAVIALAVSIGLSAHLVNASPMRARFAVALGVAIPAVIIVAMLWMQARNQNRSPSHIADHDQVVPPVLLVRRGVSLDGFAIALADLRARADANRAFVEREDPSPEEDDADSD